jgi:hypothetical protein
MELPHFHRALTFAISDMLALNRSYFGSGGPGYYGVRLDIITLDELEFDLKVIFRSGVRYCCYEAGCHFPFALKSSSPGWFQGLRNRLTAAGIENPPPMTIQRLVVVVEAGAIMDCLPRMPAIQARKLQYECGPFPEAGEAEVTWRGPWSPLV